MSGQPRRSLSIVLFAVLGVTAAMPAKAQTVPTADTSVDIQLFNYAIGPKQFLSVNDGSILGKGQLGLDLMITFLTDPYTIYNVEDGVIQGERTAVISSLAAGQLNGAYGIHRKFHIGVALPVVLAMNGDGLDPTTAMATGEGFRVAGLGDLRLELKAQLYKKKGVSIAGAPFVTIPTSVGGNDGDFMGDDLPAGGGYVAAQWQDPNGTFSTAANLGFIGRKARTLYASEVGSQATFGLAASYRPTARISLIAEAFGRTGLSSAFDTDNSPFELAGAARFKVGKAMEVTVGGGLGLVEAIGSPAFRFLASVGWSPDFGDTDNDGIGNMRDRCPAVAEDKDGFEDGDGCPDLDNDGDQRDDHEDKCPLEAEDKDGFEDDDGCPELDNDGDNLPDAKDRCPNDKEDGVKPFDKDGCPASKSDLDQDGIFDNVDKCIEDPEDFDDFNDWDGCPDNDNDGDGVEDANDECPLCKEDIDGFKDEDGCPDLDDDGDGIRDANDKCPKERETVNGYLDTDGCADTSPRSIVALDGDRVTYKGTIQFRKSRVRTAGRRIVAAVANLMQGQQLVSQWRIVVAVSTGRDEQAATLTAQARAQLIRRELINQGVPEDRLEAIGVAAERDLVAFSVFRREDANPEAGVCPLDLSATSTPAPTSGDASTSSTEEDSEQ